MVVTASDTSLPVRDNLRYLWLARYRLVILPVLAAGVWVVMLVAAILLRFELNTDRSLTGGLLATVVIAIAAQLGIGFATVL